MGQLLEFTEGAKLHSEVLALGKQFSEKMIYAVGESLIGYQNQTLQVLATFLTGGHSLVLGDVGSGKTRFGLALANLIGVVYTQVSLNGEIRPSYFTGKMIEGEYHPGILADTEFLQLDEVNRACQATLDGLLAPLESGVVNDSAGRQVYSTKEHFSAIATLNPLDNMLDRALRDRFTVLAYPPELTEAQLELLGEDLNEHGEPLVDPGDIQEPLTVKYRGEMISARKVVSILRPYVVKSGGVLIPKDIIRLLVKIYVAFRPTSDFQVESGSIGDKVMLPLSPRAYKSALSYLRAIALLKGNHSVTRDMFSHLVDTWSNRLLIKANARNPQEPAEMASARLINEVIRAVLDSEK